LLSCKEDGITTLTTICTLPVTSGSSAVYDYYVKSSGGAMRSGQILAVWNGSSATYTEYSTPDLGGSTAPLRFNVRVAGSDVIVEANVGSGTWNVHVGTRIVF
jgi:hypothetical protein